jgi:hypothetical protein
VSDVLDSHGEMSGAALRLASGQGLALDREGGGGYVGWAVYATADFDEGDPERLRDVTVAQAVVLAPQGRQVILTATLDAIAVLGLGDRAGQPASKPALRQSERLVDELVEAGQPRDTVLSLAGRLSRAHARAQDHRQDSQRLARLPPELDARFESEEHVRAVPVRPPRRRWPLLLAAAGALAVVAVVGVLILGRTEGSRPEGQAASPQPSSSVGAPIRRRPARPGARSPTVPVRLSAIGAWDPYGDGREHGEKASAAEDGDAGTYWPTETYLDGLQKPGVGLVFDAGRAARLRRLVVTTDTPGYSARIEAGSASVGPFQPVSRARTVGTTTAFSLRARAERYYVVWITRLGHGHTAHVNEVRAFGN